jgi:hypothetical protein
VVAAVQRAKDPVVLVRARGLNQEPLVVGIPLLLVVVGELLMQIPTKGMIAGEEGMVGGEVNLVLVGPRPLLEDFHNVVAVLLR